VLVMKHSQISDWSAAMTSPIIDLSHHNPTPDWGRLKAGGVLGVILKATEGSSYTDRTWEERTKAALVAGLAVSSYHFLRPAHSMRPQIDHYLSVIDRLMPLGARVCLDHEDADVSVDDLEYCVTYITDQRPDLRIAIYSGHLIKDQLKDRKNPILSEKTDLWIAQYGRSAPTWPEQVWPHWSVWQWTDKEKVPGISQPVDGNKFAGTGEELLEWFGQPIKSVPIEPPIAADIADAAIALQRLKFGGKEVLVQIDPATDQLLIHVNGEPWGPVNV